MKVIIRLFIIPIVFLYSSAPYAQKIELPIQWKNGNILIYDLKNNIQEDFQARRI